MRKRIEITIKFASLLILSFVPVRGYAINSAREITYKNVNTVLTKEDIELRGENYLFSGLTDTLPYTVIEDDLGINDLTLYDGENMRTIKIVVTDASREVDREGWTKIEASEDTRIVYVSSSEGDDDQTHPDELGNLNPGAHKASSIGVTSPDDTPNNKYQDMLRINPVMTGYKSPEGEVSASSEHWVAPAWGAFAGGETTTHGYNHWRSGGGKSQWLQYEFDGARVLHGYALSGPTHSHAELSGMPKDWTCEGSNDEQAWTVLDTVSGESNWGYGEQREFVFENSEPYRYYRLNISNTNGHDRVYLGELELMAEKTVNVTPVATIEKARSLVRNGYADWILLKRGDIWDYTVYYNNPYGRSQDEPQVWGEYGDSEESRPEIGAIWDGQNWIIRGIKTGVNFLGEAKNVLIEDCFSNISRWVPRGKNIEFRRCIILGSTVSGAMYSGRTKKLLLEENISDHSGRWDPSTNRGDYEKYLPEKEYKEGDRCHYDGALWEADEDNPQGFPSVESGEWFRPDTDRRLPSHNFYLSTNHGYARVYRNISTRAQSHGIQMGGGGVALENIFSHNPLHVLSSRGGDSAHRFRFVDNVLLNAERYIDRYRQELPRGFGVEIVNLDPEHDHLVANNILSKGLRRWVLRLRGQHDHVGGIHNLTVRDNVVYESLRGIESAYSDVTSADITDNVFDIKEGGRIVDISSTFVDAISFQRNQYTITETEDPFVVDGDGHSFSAWKNLASDSDSVYEPVEFVDPDRTLATYNASLGGEETFEGFIYTAREQSRHNWNWDYHPVRILEYFREGFTVLADPESIKISGPEELEIPVSGEKNQIYAIEIRDENDTVLKDEPFSADIASNPSGVSLSGTRLTVTPQAEPGDVIIEVKLDEDKEIRDEITVTLLYDKAAQDKVLPERSFITPSNPKLKFGEGAKGVLITDVRGNEVFRKEKGTSRFIIWNPGERGTVSIESGIYIYRIKTKDGYEYGTVVVAK